MLVVAHRPTVENSPLRGAIQDGSDAVITPATTRSFHDARHNIAILCLPAQRPRPRRNPVTTPTFGLYSRDHWLVSPQTELGLVVERLNT